MKTNTYQPPQPFTTRSFVVAGQNLILATLLAFLFALVLNLVTPARPVEDPVYGEHVLEDGTQVGSTDWSRFPRFQTQKGN